MSQLRSLGGLVAISVALIALSASCIDVEADLGDFAHDCDDDADCGDLVCVDARCVIGGGEGEGEGNPCDLPVVNAPAGPLVSERALEVLEGQPHVVGTLDLTGAICTNDTSFNLASLACLEGDLIVHDTAMTVLSLPALVEVRGTIKVGVPDFENTDKVGFPGGTGNAALTSVSTPSLTAVTGSIEMYNNPALTTLNLGTGFALGGDLYLGFNEALIHDDVPATSVGGSVIVHDNARNQEGGDSIIELKMEHLVSIGALATAPPSGPEAWISDFLDLGAFALNGGLVLYRTGFFSPIDDELTMPLLQLVKGDAIILNTMGDDLELPQLSSVASLDLSSNRFMTRAVFPALAETTTELDPTIPAVRVLNNGAMTDLRFGALHMRGALSVVDNELQSLCGFADVTDIDGTVTVTGNNASLPACQIERLKEIAGQPFSNACAIPAYP